MAKFELTSVVEKRKKRVSFESPNQQETRMENSSTLDHVQKSRAKWLKMKELVDPKGPFIPMWNVIFIVSCVFAVLLDPLFLYIPIINDDIKCVRSDNKLKVAALVLRSVTDLCYLWNIFFQVMISSTNSSALPRRISFLPNMAKTILIDILSVLPIPQIIVLKFYFNMRGSRSFVTWTLINFFVLVQYVPRIFRIYLSCKEFKKYTREEIPIWLKGVLNFFLYILASHVIGAFWYFFAIQQITTCWQYACRPENGCVPNNLYCHDHHALRNIKIIDELCSVDPPNEKLFNFGIFLDILQMLSIFGQPNYFEKFSNCFGWGLRNLSSFGSNLKPSINAWENLFANFISITGLLLFLYLIGNLQTYMQLDTQRLETQRWKMRILKKIEKKDGEVEQWLSKTGIPSSKKSEIMMRVRVELKANKDVDVENILSILPEKLQTYMETCMPLNRLKQVPLLQDNMDEGVLRAISGSLVPKKYTKNEIIIREKEPLKMMIFIVEGLIIIEMRDCSSTLTLSAGKVYGEKLLSWPAWPFFPALPVATESARADGDVEALVLLASDIMQVGEWPWSSLQLYFLSKEITSLTDDGWELLESDRVTMLRKVPKLKSMATQVLNAISENLKPMRVQGKNVIIRHGHPLRMMVFVTEGSLTLIKPGDEHSTNDREFYGEELLDWVLDRSFPAIVPISTHDGWVDKDIIVDILVLMAKDLGSVVSNFKSHFREITSPTDSSLDLCARVGLYWLKKEPSIFQCIDDEVLEVISKHFKLMTYSVNTYVVRENNPLEYMFIFVNGYRMSIESTCRPFEPRLLDIGEFDGEELVQWVTNWASHTIFPHKLPLSTGNVKVLAKQNNSNAKLLAKQNNSNVKMGIDDTDNAGVLVLWADDLKSIVSKFKSHFIKQTTLPVDSQWKLSTFDPLATLKKVPQFEDMDPKKLEEIHRSLISIRYDDMSPYIITEKLDKMILIVSGLVSVRSVDYGLVKYFYRYSGNYCGDKLLEWALHPSRDHNNSLPKSDVWVEAVGEVETLILRADDLMKELCSKTIILM